MTCKDCIYYEACHEMYYEEHAIQHFNPDKPNADKDCGTFKDRSRFVELPYYKYTAEERFRGAVQELIDIAKASETPSKILRATSESLAHFACELSKLEEAKQALKECENNA